jgi:hypothetical protein
MRVLLPLAVLLGSCTFHVAGVDLQDLSANANDLSGGHTDDLASFDQQSGDAMMSIDSALSDGMVDSATPPDFSPASDLQCVAGCNGATLRTCSVSGSTDQTCALGCSTSGSPHCQQMVPSGGSVTTGDLTVGALSNVLITANVVLDSDTGAISGGVRNATASGVIDHGIEYRSSGKAGIFIFNNLSVAMGFTVSLRGSKAVALVAVGDIHIDGVLDGTQPCASPTPSPGPGGQFGGAPGQSSSGAGHGGAGKGAHNSSSGGGGAGYSAVGGAGGISATGGGNAAVSGGSIVALDLTKLQGGFGGGGGGAGQSSGGGGGAAIQLVAGGTIFVTNGANGGINAGGCGGTGPGLSITAANSGAGGGGGSGGLILLEAQSINISGTLAANGGGGAAADSSGTAGQNGKLGTAAANGGTNSDGTQTDAGGGGAGGTKNTAAVDGTGDSGTTTIHNGGGGGGGVGYIWLNAYNGQLTTGGGTFSPTQGSGAITLQ